MISLIDYIKWDYKIPIGQLGETVFWMIRNYWDIENNKDNKNNKNNPNFVGADVNYRIKFIPYHRHEWWEYWKDKDYMGYMARRKGRVEALKEPS